MIGGMPLARAIEFWFDFGSSYAYFAAMEIDALAERCDRPVLWRPFLLGTAFRQTGAQGLSSTPLKKDYAARDWARLARARGIAFSPPPGHPAITLAATRAYYTLEDADPDQARAFAREVFRRVYQSGDLDTSDADQVARLGAGFGIDLSEANAIAGLVEGGKAAKADMRIGDVIIAADGMNVGSMKLLDVMQKGKSSYVFTVVRPAAPSAHDKVDELADAPEAAAPSLASADSDDPLKRELAKSLGNLKLLLTLTPPHQKSLA